MKKFLLITILVVALSSSSFAFFAIGINAGAGFSKITAPTFYDLGTVSNTSTTTQLGWQVNVAGKLSFMPLFGLRFELGFHGFTGKTGFTTVGSINSIKAKHTVFQIFLGPQFNIGGFFIYGGGFLGFKVKSTYSGTSNSFPISGNIDANKIIAGHGFGIGYNVFSISKIKFPITLDFKYNLRSIGKEWAAINYTNLSGSKSWSIMLTFGVMLDI